MTVNLKISKKADITIPAAILFFVNEKGEIDMLEKVEAPFSKYKDYIKAQLTRKNYFFQLLDNDIPFFVQLIKLKPGDKKYQINESVRQAGSKLQKEISKYSITGISLIIPENEHYLTYYAEGIILSGYQFLKYKSEGDKYKLEELFLIGEKISKKEVEELAITSAAVFIARDLVNEPGSYLTAVQLGEEIISLSKQYGFSTEILNKQKIEVLKMGGLLAVNKGSIDPPTFSILEWNPSSAKNKKPVILVGKGVVFDTGGLSLKPTLDSMDRMKSDMAGAAMVIGAFCAVTKLNLPIHLIGLIPATDNRPGEKACFPGDVIKMYDGSTVEVLNTDAEGRMLLADALAYAKKFKPAFVLDAATLTGAAAMALGSLGSIVLGNADKKYFELLNKSGKDTFERMVKFPLWDEYNELIKSDIADVKNTGGTHAGTITAAKFLERFTDYPWLHLDIAGVAFNKSGSGYISKGASGYGVRLLVSYLKRINLFFQHLA